MKTLTDILYNKTTNTIKINYFDDIGNLQQITKSVSDLTSDELSHLTSLSNDIQTDLNNLIKIKAKVFNVLLLDSIFFIQGESYPPQSHKIADLSTTVLVTGTSLTQKQVSDNLYSFVLSATSNSLISLSAPFGTNTVVINGTTMNYTTISTASGSVLSNATQLVIDLFNQ